MIVAAVLMLFGGGAGMQLLPFDFTDRVERVVPDGVRRDSIMALYKQAQDELEDYGKEVDGQLDRFFKGLKGHDMPIDSLTPMVGEVKWTYSAARKEGLEWRRSMIELLSPEEWDQVFADD